MFTKTIVPDSASITIDLPASYVGEHVRVIAIIEKDESIISDERRKNVSQIYSNYPKIDLTKFKFDREEANDFE